MNVSVVIIHTFHIWQSENFDKLCTCSWDSIYYDIIPSVPPLKKSLPHHWPGGGTGGGRRRPEDSRTVYGSVGPSVYLSIYLFFPSLQQGDPSVSFHPSEDERGQGRERRTTAPPRPSRAHTHTRTHTHTHTHTHAHAHTRRGAQWTCHALFIHDKQCIIYVFVYFVYLPAVLFYLPHLIIHAFKL